MNNLIQIFIEEQVQYLPNIQSVIDFWIIAAAELLDTIIVEDNFPISDFTPVHMSSLI